MDKTINAEWKPDYASVHSLSNQAPKVEIGTEDLLSVNFDEVRVPNILSAIRTEYEVQSKLDYSYKLKKPSVKPQSSNASMCCMCHAQYIKSTGKLMICERCDCWCSIKCLKMSSNEYKVQNSRSDCH